MKVIVPVALVIVVFVITQTSQVAAFSVRELLGLDKPKPAETEQQQAQAKTNKESGTEWATTAKDAAASNPQLRLDYVALLVANMSEAERQKVLSDQKVFKQAIENEAFNRSVLSAAIANKMDRDKNVEFLMQRGAENILREAYLNRLIASKLPSDFPSAEQVAEYYQNNKEQFVIPERVYVWQIFYKKTENASDKEVKTLKANAKNTYDKLKKGKAEFADVAIAESEHTQSKANGGYMGLIKSKDLIPEIKDNLLKLKEGELSQPVESEAGIHILKRGKIIPAETVKLEQVEPQIKQLLVKQANVQLRQAIFAQAGKEFPQKLSDNKIEEWRLRLKTDTAASN